MSCPPSTRPEAIMLHIPGSHESVGEHALHHAEWRAVRDARHAERVARTTSLHTSLVGELAQRPNDRQTVELHPLTFDDRSANELRPATFDTMIGQERLKVLLRRIVAAVVAAVQTSGRPLDHLLLAGQSGTGKTTLAQVTAHELGRTVYQIKAPVGHDVLTELCRVCHDGDVVIVDEIHQQVKGDRRGVNQAADPEDFYHIMEDRRLPTAGGMVPFPAVTFMGATTDEGLLPEAFLNRFPLRLTLDAYTWDEMGQLAVVNAHALRLPITDVAADTFGRASRRNPRQVNTYIRNAIALGASVIDNAVAVEVVCTLNGCTLDGLTLDMQRMLRCLLAAPKFSASVSTVSTALGHSRDTKAIALFVEPYLISEGYVQVAAGVGRRLTDAGITRARQLQP